MAKARLRSFAQKGIHCVLAFVLAFSLIPSAAFAQEATAGQASAGSEAAVQQESSTLEETPGIEVADPASPSESDQGSESDLAAQDVEADASALDAQDAPDAQGAPDEATAPQALEDVLSGAGTAADPYQISSVADLNAVRAAVNADKTDAYASACYALMADLVLEDDWEPLGKTQTYPFKGTFQGNNHTISGLNINVKTSYTGLFGYVVDAEITDVRVEGTIVAPRNVGGVVGYAKNSRLIGLASTCNITACTDSSGYYGYQFGGIVGGAVNSEIIGCAYEGAITHGGLLSASNAGYGDVGGVCGYLNGGAIRNSYNKGTIKASLLKIGGIVGDVNGEIVIDSCYNAGDLSHCSVNGSDYGKSYEGGIVGAVSSLNAFSMFTMRNCFNAGAITTQSTYEDNVHLGGLLGYTAAGNVASYPQAITNNYYLEGSATYAFEDGRSANRGDVSGQGEAVTSENAQEASFAATLGGSFAPDTAATYNAGMPYLRWQAPGATYDIAVKASLANARNSLDEHPFTITIANDGDTAVLVEAAASNTAQAGTWIAAGLADDATYTCTVEKEGYEPQTCEVELLRGGATVMAVLQPVAYQASLTVTPADAVVEVRQQTGTGASTVCAPHDVRVADDGSSATYTYAGFYREDVLSYSVSAYGHVAQTGSFEPFGLANIEKTVDLTPVSSYTATLDVQVGAGAGEAAAARAASTAGAGAGEAAAAGEAADAAAADATAADIADAAADAAGTTDASALDAQEAEAQAQNVIIPATVPESIATELRAAIASSLEAGSTAPVVLVYYRNAEDSLFNNKVVYDSRTPGSELAAQGTGHFVGAATGLIPGTYAYVAYAAGYPTASGSFDVAAADCTVAINILSMATDKWDGTSVDLSWYLNNPGASEFHLYTAAELAGLSALVGGNAFDNNGEAVAAESFAGKTVYLDADIDLAGNVETGANYWTPIGSYLTTGYHFKGTFDGQGHSISGLVMGKSADQTRLHKKGTATGLFSAVYGSSSQPAALRNLVLVAPVMQTDAQNTTSTGAGILVGNASWATIENIRIEGGSLTHAKEYVGGIVGRVGTDANVTLRDCYNSATISSGRYNVGGIAGSVSGPVTIERCINEGSVLAETSTYQTVVTYGAGGIVGGVSASSAAVAINQCVNTGAISAAVGSVGGIVGALGSSVSSSVNYASISDCYNTGTVVNLSTSGGTNTVGGINVGGIAGYLSAKKYTQLPYAVRNCYNAGPIDFGAEILPERVYGGGIVGQAAYANVETSQTILNCYNVSDLCGAAPIGRNYTYDENAAYAGVAEAVSLDQARQASFAQRLGGAWKADDADAPQNNGLPLLKAFDANAQWDVSLSIALDTQANNDYVVENGAIATEGTLPSLQILNAQGQEVAVDNLAATVAEDGAVSFAATCSVPNGTYVYYLSKQGYNETPHSVIDPGTGEPQVVYDSQLTGTFMVNYSNVDQAISMTATKYPYEITVVDANDATPLSEANVELSAADGTAVAASSFDEEAATWTFELYNGTYGARISQYGYNTLVSNADAGEGALTVSYGASQRTVKMHQSAQHLLSVLVSPQQGAFQDSQAVIHLWSEAKDFGVQVIPADDLGASTVEMTLPDDTYHYEVRAGGFAAAQGTVELNGQDEHLELTLEALAPWDGSSIDVSWYDAQSQTYYLSSAAELAGLAALVNGTAQDEQGAALPADSFEGKTVVLLSNVSLENKEWTPIGTTDAYGGAVRAFAGTFDGAGHGIYGLKITVGARAGMSAAAFVAAAGADASFKNLTLEGSISGTTKTAVSAVAGFVGVTEYGSSGSLTFENCGSQVAINVNGVASTVNYAAGLVGWSKTTLDISGSYNQGPITLTGKDATRVGGLVAYSNGSPVKIRACYSTAAIDVSLQDNTANSAVGGLAGTVGSETLTMENCYVSGLVKGYSGQNELLVVGALVGQNTGGTARDSYIVRSYVKEGTANQTVGVGQFLGTDGSLARTDEAMRQAAFVDEMNEGLEGGAEGGALFVASTTFPQFSWERTVTGVELLTLPSKVAYNDQERFDATGMSLKVSYSAGDDQTVSSGWFIGNGACLKPGQETVTVEYAGFSIEVPLTVTQIEHETISRISLELAGPVEGGTAANQVAITSAVNTKYIPQTYTAQVRWLKEGVEVAEGAAWENNAFYRAEVEVDAHYVDGDAWYVLPENVEVSVAAAEGTPAPLDVLYAKRSEDGKTYTLTCTYEALGRASDVVDSASLHLYYKGDARARQYNHVLDTNPVLTLAVEGETFEFTAEDIERGVLNGTYRAYQGTYSVLDETGTAQMKTYGGVSLYQFLSASVPARIADATEITVVSGTGARVATTMGDVRETARCYDPENGETTVPALLAFACDGAPMIAASALTDSQGPLMVVTGQPAATLEGLVQNVARIEIDQLQSEGMQVVTFSASSGSIRLRNVEVTVTDCYGNELSAENSRVVLNDNETYSYVLSVDGYSSQQGSFVLEGSPLEIEAQLLRVYNGVPTQPRVNQDDGFYEIYTPEELVWWVTNGSSTDNVRLMADVALNDGVTYDRQTSFGWPAGTFGAKEEKAFCGTFDGNGHTIYGFYLCRENTIDLWLDWSGDVCMLADNISQLGLFGYTNGATIANLGVEGRIDVVDRPDSSLASWMQIGGIAGYAMRTSISNCTTNISVNHVQAQGGGSLGGVSFDGWPQLQDANIGGICGTAAAGTVIENCYTRGTYYSAGTRTAYVGGIAGQLRGYGTSPVQVKNCYSTASWYVAPVGASGYRSYVGGIVGKTYTMREETTPQVIGCVALNRTFDGGSASTTQGNRVVGDCSSVVVENCAALAGMMPVQCAVDTSEAGYGQDMSLAASTVQASYERLGWTAAEEGQLDGWQFPEDRLPLLAWQDANAFVTPDQQLGNVSYTPGGNGDIGSNFNESAPPAQFTVYAQVEGHDPRVARVFSSKELLDMAQTKTMKLSGYTFYSAYGRAVTQYVPLTDVIDAAGLSFESGNSWVVSGFSYDYDTYVGTPRYYFPNWVQGSTEGAVEVPTALTIKSYGGSAYTSDDLLDIAVFSADYLYAYMTTYGQVKPTEENVSNWIYQQVEGTVLYDADQAAQEYVHSLLLDTLSAGQALLDNTLVGSDPADIPEGFGFAAQERHDELRAALASARSVYGSDQATNGQVMDQVEAVEAANAAFGGAVRQGTKGVDFAGLSAALDVALEYLQQVTDGDIAVGDGTGLEVGSKYVATDVYTRLAVAVENGQTMLDDAYTSQASVDSAEVLLTAVVQEFEDAVQEKTTPDAPATVVDLLKTIISTLSDALFGGHAIEPDFVIYYDGRILTAGVDYTVTYYGNDAPGTAVAVIQGTGAFSGTVVKTFTIEAGDASAGETKEFTLHETYDEQGQSMEEDSQITADQVEADIAASDATAPDAAAPDAGTPDAANAQEATEQQGASADAAQPSASIMSGSDGAEYVAGELIVTYDNAQDGTLRAFAENDVVSALSSKGVEVEQKLANSTSASGTVSLVSFNDDEDVMAKAQEVASLPGVASAQPNYVYRLMDTDISPNWLSDDPYAQVGDGTDRTVPNQYYLYGTVVNDEGKVVSRGANVLDAWDYATCDGQVTIAVLDTGCNLTHEDLVDNLIVDLAYDTHNGKSLVASGSFNGDYFGHGTHCCGIAAAATNNGVGIAGASGNAKVLPIKVFNDDTTEPGCYTSSLVSAYNYLFELIDAGTLENLHVINMSLGGYGGMDSAFKTQIEQAYNNYSIVTVAAGGNGDDNNEPYTQYSYPSDWDVCLSVTALDQMGRNCNWSDYNDKKDISAPGLYLWSTYLTNNSSYRIMSGTSMASPLVAGIAALCFAADPNATADQVVEAIKSTADPITDPDDKYQRWPSKTGSTGAVNAAEAVKAMSGAHIFIPEGQSSVYRTQTVQLTAGISDASESESANLQWSWSIVPGTGTATITDDGLVTALTAGTVKAVAATTFREREYEASCTLNIKEIELPSQPSATKAYSNDIALMWQAAPLANEYVIERKAAGQGEFEQLMVVENDAAAQTGITYRDTTANQATVYTYRITPQIHADGAEAVVGKTSNEVQGARLDMVATLATQQEIAQRHQANNAIFGGSTDTVVLMNEDDAAASLLAAGYAGISSAVVLTTAGQTLEPDVAAAIKLADPAHIVLFGTEDSLAANLEEEAGQAAPSATVTRKSAATLSRAAEQIYQEGKGYWGSVAFIMDGSGAAPDELDSLTAMTAAYAYAAGAPVFFTAGGKLSVTTRQNLSAGAFSNVIILGGTDLVSSEVETQLTRAGLNYERITSRAAFATAARFSAQAVESGASATTGYVVGPLDAALSLQAAALTRAMGAVYISVEPGNEDALAAVVDQNDPKPLVFVGREGKTLSSQEIQRVQDYVNSTTVTPEITEVPDLVEMSQVEVAPVADQRYTGQAVEPDLTVSYQGNALVEGEDYTVAYSDNVAEGTATATLTGQGNYTGTKTVNFTIGRPSMQAVQAASVEPQHYTGKEVKPSVSLSYQGEPLVEGVDYVLYYSNNIEPGTGVVICVGKGAFKDARLVEFQIVESVVSEGDFSVSASAYVQGQPYVLVSFTGTVGQGKVPTLLGAPMVWTGSAYQALVKNDQAITKWSFGMAEGAAEQASAAGDVNGNGRVNIVDAQLAYDLACGVFTDFSVLSMSQWLAADANGDAVVDATDAFAIQYRVMMAAS